MRQLRFNVFGTLVTITGAPGAWQAFYPGSASRSEASKRRPADFIVSDDIPEEGLLEYLADFFHEDATPRRPNVLRLS
jgi:hypothetical protein